MDKTIDEKLKQEQQWIDTHLQAIYEAFPYIGEKKAMVMASEPDDINAYEHWYVVAIVDTYDEVVNDYDGFLDMGYVKKVDDKYVVVIN